MTTEFDYEDMTDEQLADYYLQEAIKSAQITLQWAENCFQKFGKRTLSDVQKTYFEKLAKGELPTDEEQFNFDVEALEQERQTERRRKNELGEAYKPKLALEDKTDGFCC